MINPVASSTATSCPAFSVVVPIYNEEDNVVPLYDEIRATLEIIGKPWELIFVDDASTDSSPEKLQTIATSDSRVCIETFQSNSGQGAALFAGMKAAMGTVVITMDGDGQNVPADIVSLLESLNGGVDMVVGTRTTRRDTKLRRVMSRLANGVRARFLGDGLNDSGCALKVMRREVITALIPIQTLYSFVPALASGAGFTLAERPVQHRERQSGQSNYGLLKMLWRPFVDMIGVAWYNWRRSDKTMPKSQGASGSRVTKLLAVVFIVASFFLFVGNHGLLEPDEGRYAEVAREMTASGDYFIPTLNGFSHVEKPPFIYWVTTLCYNAFGVSEFSARLPSVLAALGTMFLTFQIGIMLGGTRVAWLAMIILASAVEFFLLARTLTPDMIMCFWITAAIACLVKHHIDKQRSIYSWLFFVAMGVGFLTKGPMAIVVPTFAAIGLAISRRSESLQKLDLPWNLGGLISIGIALSWFIVASGRHPHLYDYFVQTELLDRFLSSSHGRSQPWWFFLPILIAGFLPWTLFLLKPAASLFRKIKNRNQFGANTWLLIGWLIPPFVILSVSGSKLLTYVLPLFPGLAIATALSIRSASHLSRQSLYLFATMCFSAAIISWLLPVIASGDLAIQFSPFAISGFVLAAISLVFCAQSSSSANFRPTAFAMAALICWLSLASQVPRANGVLAQQASVKNLASLLKSQPDFEHARIVSANIRAHGLEFYLRSSVEVTEGQADLVFAPNETQAARLHANAKSVSRLKCRTCPIYVVTRTDDYQKHFLKRHWNSLGQCGDFVLAKKDSEVATSTECSGCRVNATATEL
ncbi:MAG: 4-amino-4-deoxy-L-arabinose transferase-like glycosyltransferase [Verrucomicrobiales bacterium]|jgi:4-amino-4-deoxy-L-arabinose transferase-like glycosyltransferase